MRRTKLKHSLLEGREVVTATLPNGLVVRGSKSKLLESVALLEAFTPELASAFKRCTKGNRQEFILQLKKLGVDINAQDFTGSKVRSARDPLMMDPGYITIAIFNKLSYGKDNNTSAIILYYKKQALNDGADMYSESTSNGYRSPGARSWTSMIEDADYFYCIKLDAIAMEKVSQLRRSRSESKSGAVGLDRDQKKQYRGGDQGWYTKSNRMIDTIYDKSWYIVDKNKYIRLLMTLDLDTTMVSFGKKLSSFITSLEDKYAELKPTLRSMTGSKEERSAAIMLGALVTEGDKQFGYVANALQQVSEAKSEGISEKAINWYIDDPRKQMKFAKEWIDDTRKKLARNGIEL
jgi:hypothetical protein